MIILPLPPLDFLYSVSRDNYFSFERYGTIDPAADSAALIFLTFSPHFFTIIELKTVQKLSAYVLFFTRYQRISETV